MLLRGFQIAARKREISAGSLSEKVKKRGKLILFLV